MKKLIINNPGFEYLEKGFKEWLDVLGYCDAGVYTMPNILREFLHYIDAQGVKQIVQLEQKHIRAYHDYISSRPNQRRGGGLSSKYVLMHIKAVEKFLAYLNHKGAKDVPSIGIRLTAPQKKDPTVLTRHEIGLLFEATQQQTGRPKQEAINARDKAMLTIYYSCGLRKNEGVHVQTDHINFDTRILHVKKGKNYKERFVPLNKTNAKYLEEYIYDHRPNLVKDNRIGALFVSAHGTPLKGQTLYNRLKFLQTQTDDITLQQKHVGLHTLRHSIATHLLQAGMSLEKIARFLGHATMDSTQIYTHIINKNE